MNTLLIYQYRDASNYKELGLQIFKGGFAKTDLKRFKNQFEDADHFSISRSGLPHPAKNMAGFPNQADHDWVEFITLEPTEKPATDTRSFRQFVGDFSKSHSKSVYTYP